MDTINRTVRCSSRGLSQEDALQALYDHPEFKIGTKVLSIKEAGGQWIAKINEPVTRQSAPPPFPPKDEEATEEEPVDGPPKPEEAEEGPTDPTEDAGPPKPEDGKEEGKGEKGELAEISHLLHLVVDALGLGTGDPMAGPDGPPVGPEGPPPPPGPAGPPHAPGPPGGKMAPPPHPRRPGETPPGTTPINTPAFSSVDPVGRVASFEAHEVTDMSVKDAHAQLTDLYGPHGYKVKKIVSGRTDTGKRTLHAKLAVR